MNVQIVTPYRVGYLQCYGVTVRGNVTSVYPPLKRLVYASPVTDADVRMRHAKLRCGVTFVTDLAKRRAITEKHFLPFGLLANKIPKSVKIFFQYIKF
jgi:hypothetical protein